MNTTPIEHTCSNGLLFKAERGDLSTGVEVYNQFRMAGNEACADFAEFGAWHAMNIRENLNGFAGYDAINYIFKESEPEELNDEVVE